MTTTPEIASVSGGVLQVRFHSGQMQAWDSERRFVLVLAGTQGGKTSFGPHWLYREIQRRGPGDYLVAAPTYPLMQKKVLPEFLRLFRDTLQLGDYRVSERTFVLSDRGEEITHGTLSKEQTQIFFGHAQDPDSLESATAKAAWLDEAGQKKFKLGSWEAIQRRLSIHEGRVLATTTPYTLGWLKSELHDPARRGAADIDLVQFESLMNPAFPRAEFERMRAKMPRWKFNMMYRGIFERPAGMIYDCFEDRHRVGRFDVPEGWPRYVGLDFGGVNTAAVFIAENPDTKELYLYREYHAGGRTAREHADFLKRGEPAITRAVGGSHSEDQWRNEFRQGGLIVSPPDVKDVEVGIDRVYELFKTGRLHVFDDLRGLIDELESYSRELDDSGEPTEKIEDKETYHRLDALRYIASFINRKSSRFGMGYA